MQRIQRRIAFLAFVIAVAPSLSALGADAESILKSRETELFAGNFEAILGLFADDAVVATSSGRLLIGKEQIRAWVQDQVDRRQREEAGPRQLLGNKHFWSGRVYRSDWQKLGVSPLDVMQDAIIQDGQIKFFNTTFTAESAAKLQAARKKR